MDLCQIGGNTIYGGGQLSLIMQISPGKNQISRRLRYIEIIKPIGINEIIADIKAISYTYLRHLAYVKPFNPRGGTL
jgi:hypothetical protein